MTDELIEQEDLIDYALSVALKGVQINDGRQYMVPAHDLVEYAETIKALVELLRRTEERGVRVDVAYPQGEPSDATHAAEIIAEHQPYTPANGGYGCMTCGVEMQSWKAFSGHLARVVERTTGEGSPEPQGEPSDAQVLAALNAYWGYEHGLGTPLGAAQRNARIGRMRAALCAAGEANRG